MLTNQDQTDLAYGFYRAELNGTHIIKNPYNLTPEIKSAHITMCLKDLRKYLIWFALMIIFGLFNSKIGDNITQPLPQSTAVPIRWVAFLGTGFSIVWLVAQVFYSADVYDRATDSWHFGNKANIELAQAYNFYLKKLDNSWFKVKILKRPYYGATITELRDFFNKRPELYKAIYYKLMLAYYLGYGQKAVDLLYNDKFNHDFANLRLMSKFDADDLNPETLQKMQKTQEGVTADLEKINQQLNKMLKPYMSALLFKLAENPDGLDWLSGNLKGKIGNELIKNL